MTSFPSRALLESQKGCGSYVETFNGCTLSAAALVNPHLLLSAVLCVASGSILPLCLGVGVDPDRAGADAVLVQPTQAF